MMTISSRVEWSSTERKYSFNIPSRPASRLHWANSPSSSTSATDGRRPPGEAMPEAYVPHRHGKTQPWCIYSVHLSSLINFALVTDALLIYLPWTNLTHPANPRFFGVPLGLWSLRLWILGTKMVKTWPHFQRYPRRPVLLTRLHSPRMVPFVHQSIRNGHVLGHRCGDPVRSMIAIPGPRSRTMTKVKGCWGPRMVETAGMVL